VGFRAWDSSFTFDGIYIRHYNKSLVKNRNAILRCLFIIVLFCVPQSYTSFKVFLESSQKDFTYYNFIFDFNDALRRLVQIIHYTLPVVILIILTNESFAEYGFNKVTVKELLKSLLRLFCLTLVFSIVFRLFDLRLNQKFNYGYIFNLSKEEKNTTLLIVIHLLLTFLLAFEEELLFRSFFYKNLNKIIGKKWICVIIVNIFFGIIHIYQGIIPVLITFTLGIIFSIEFKKHNNIYTVSIFHALRNLYVFMP